MEMEGGGWTVLQKRFEGRVDFHRTWQEYKKVEAIKKKFFPQNKITQATVFTTNAHKFPEFGLRLGFQDLVILHKQSELIPKHNPTQNHPADENLSTGSPHYEAIFNHLGNRTSDSRLIMFISTSETLYEKISINSNIITSTANAKMGLTNGPKSC